MTPEERGADVVRRHEAGMTFKAIAVELGVSTGRAQQLYHEHLRRLRRTLDADIERLQKRYGELDMALSLYPSLKAEMETVDKELHERVQAQIALMLRMGDLTPSP